MEKMVEKTKEQKILDDYKLHPDCYVTRPFGLPVEVFRCKTDFSISTANMIRKGWCRGHTIMQPVIATPWEKIKIWLRIIK